MTLNSIYFLPFLILNIVGVALLQVMGKRGLKKYVLMQKVFLLVSSYIFIGLASYKYLLIMLLTSLFVYFCGISLGRKKEKWLLTFSISILIIELGYFKYTNFFLSTFAKYLHKDFVLLNIILPLGISFYIFTSIGYLVDVYKSKYNAEKNFINLALMISLFTKVISGPIVRGDNFLPQMNQYKGLSFNEMQNGIQIFSFGLFKKIVLADHCKCHYNS